MAYYEITISLGGQHYFATAERSITSGFHFEAMVRDFKKRYPESEGFKVTAVYWEKIGRTMNTEGF